MVYRFLQQFTTNIDFYIPDRYEEGYGVSHKGVDYAHSTGVGLIIVLDCGIKAIEEIAYAKELVVAWRSCMHSSSALCTFDGARLISSASTRFAKTGPFLTENVWSFWL